MGKHACLFVLTTFFSCAVCGSRGVAEDRKIDPVTFWWGILSEKKLTELAPAKGYVTSKAAWTKLWKAWRPDEKLPDVDFTKQLVLVDLAGRYPAAYELRLTEQGDLKIQLRPRVPPGAGFGYGIAVIDRSGVKTIKGKAVEPD